MQLTEHALHNLEHGSWIQRSHGYFDRVQLVSVCEWAKCNITFPLNKQCLL